MPSKPPTPPNQPMVAQPRLSHVFDVSVAVGPPLSIGEVGTGERRVVDITGA